jgi:two-component system, chemotaxis family, chemotaxis protein CheY
MVMIWIFYMADENINTDERSASATPEQDSSKKRAVIVDDSSFMRKIITDVLLEAGIEVVAEGSDGIQAVELFRYYKPDLLFLDIMMPNKTGLDALLEVKKQNPWAKVIVITSLVQEEVEERAKKLGATLYLKKPIDRDQVVDILKHLT